MKCLKCGTSNQNDFAFCLQCGAELAPSRAGQPFASDASADLTSAGVAEPPSSSARLRVEQGSVDRREFVLDKPDLAIGRRIGNDIVINDANVSRHHARLFRHDGGFAIEDTNSANGTVLNDERVEEARILRHGDVIRIGDAVFVYETAEQKVVADHTTTGLGSGHPLAEGSPVEAQADLPAEPLAAIDLPVALPGDDQSARQQEVALEQAREDGQAAQASPRLQTLSDRLTELQQSLAALAADLREFSTATAGPGTDRLRELDSLLAELAADSDPGAVQPALDALQELSSQPRDIELLLKLSQHAGTLNHVLRLHARLLQAAPDLRQALRPLVD
jgi:pSer/pThr/pTyr-binding forkhead associated (FHA) protein